MSCKITVTSGLIAAPGSTIFGIINCDIHSNVGIREIRCILKGRESTSFKQGKTQYHGRNEFLLQKHILHEAGTLLAGSYQYPFQFVLPDDLPHSLERPHGTIKYSIKATVDIPFDFDYEDKVPLTVNYPIDLNLQPGILLGNINYEWDESIGCLCFESGSAYMKVTLEGRNAYVPGETIKMLVYIQNFTRNNIERLDVALRTATHCKSDGGRSMWDKNTLCMLPQEGMSARSEKTYSIDFKIPQSVVPYSLVGCKLIESFIELRVEGVFAVFLDNLIIDIKLILGHIPLVNNGESG